MFTHDNIIGLDFETYAFTSLPDHGLQRYVECDTFCALLAGVAIPRHNGSAIERKRFDFVRSARYSDLFPVLEDKYIVAHNAGFERAVLKAMGLDLPADRFIDSAVIARMAGAAGKLEAAGPQLLDIDKIEEGKQLMRLFSIAKPDQVQREFNPQLVEDNINQWFDYGNYCEVDAVIGLNLMLTIGMKENWFTIEEHANQAVTMEMNSLGWPVDIPLVEEMNRRYLENLESLEAEWREENKEPELNFASHIQLKAWCQNRGIKANSFDEKNVAKLYARISKRLEQADDNSRPLDQEKYVAYCQVLSLLELKQALGGSSLKKLKTILDTVSKDDRLRDQYLHIGAGQSYRTTGKGVQMQNLKRLSEVLDVETVHDLDAEWTNTDLATNIRQVFTSSHPQGQLIVGDFKSVESRMLGWLAGETWKIDAYRKGLDVYKVQAQRQFGGEYENITKDQRQFGKVGELSCGYQAGGEAVRAFAEGMGVILTEAESAQLVRDWRSANPATVIFWSNLETLIQECLEHTGWTQSLGAGALTIRLKNVSAPVSLQRLHPGCRSMEVYVTDGRGVTRMRRVFHGIYRRGTNVGYYKPSELKSGELWKNHFTDPKTKQVKFYTIYGGKLAGIVTQSLCRELFFNCLRGTYLWCRKQPNLDLIGQFHDEIVLDWWPDPSGVPLGHALSNLGRHMSDAGWASGFPLEADIKHDYRYTK